LDVGGDLVDRRSGFGHVGNQFVSRIKEGNSLILD
jgi:hypothetical protein